MNISRRKLLGTISGATLSIGISSGSVSSHSHNTIYGVDNDSLITALNAYTGEVHWQVNELSGGIRGCGLSPDGRYLGASSWNGDVGLLNTEDGSVEWEKNPHPEGVEFIEISDVAVFSGSRFNDEFSWSPDGDDYVKAFDISDGEPLWTSTEHADNSKNLWTIGIQPDYTELYTGSNGYFVAHDPSDGSTNWTATFSSPIRGIAVHPDGDYAIIGNGSETAQIDLTDQGSKGWTGTDHSSQVTDTAVGKDGEVAYACDMDGGVFAYDHSTGDPLWSVSVGTNLRGISVVPDNSYLAVGARYGNFYVLNTDDGSTEWEEDDTGIFSSWVNDVESGSTPLQLRESNLWYNEDSLVTNKVVGTSDGSYSQKV